jgi:hypothetical protein
MHQGPGLVLFFTKEPGPWRSTAILSPLLKIVAYEHELIGLVQANTTLAFLPMGS